MYSIFGYTFRANRYAGFVYSVLARAGYGLARSADGAFSERSSVGSFSWHLNLRRHGDGLRGRGRSLIRLGEHISMVYFRNHWYNSLYRRAQHLRCACPACLLELVPYIPWRPGLHQRRQADTRLYTHYVT